MEDKKRVKVANLADGLVTPGRKGGTYRDLPTDKAHDLCKDLKHPELRYIDKEMLEWRKEQVKGNAGKEPLFMDAWRKEQSLREAWVALSWEEQLPYFEEYNEDLQAAVEREKASSAGAAAAASSSAGAAAAASSSGAE
ncbi:unnamed protein product [Vitrella brassicaformis CCMP3155]|uniref:Uncharacterized protein n=1 Tax=Vitrella brassicaformis (strain CCMP3155) TaxID=1169540 RepID=A0A0G4FXS0_VITBC|nr:unnamed protein product [Vitrella brassicaformis CCMP3155]|mmetsp:Transcript_8392/g.20519  ORF Transcript_8392/g.20519 Transcript_8392/m.20519 type:complete len:139 (-) Transcript_8392:136-552(-)|eukprot:CEM20217.1 unnamed protein product [Vitrella brassicaformis CCMP3155]